jgi:hypothetical protein
MRKLGTRQQAALDVVARHFSATWEAGGDGDSPDAYLAIRGKRIAVAVTAIEHGTAEPADRTEPRLRFDRTALRVVEGLRAALAAHVPDGQAVVLTVTAPIRLPSKTIAALESKIGDCLARRSARVEVRERIHGNQVRARLLKGLSRKMPKVIGFVHNPDSDPDVLLGLAQTWLRRIGAMADERPPERIRGDRWLVVADTDGLSYVETYRHICSQLSAATDFKKILVVLAGGRLEVLAG